ncbi:hypothetical protein DPEC_G00291720 [Dallia pectoralis]|uniref:Uncharacterized protein n=1 Tax=Dallia pectoralis TaxID=75939 RepID=A0ACC2FHW6_DALPE|nr:hypothetical protein DPEC_G00291720 [Dallia pectoralis]
MVMLPEGSVGVQEAAAVPLVWPDLQSPQKSPLCCSARSETPLSSLMEEGGTSLAPKETPGTPALPRPHHRVAQGAAALQGDVRDAACHLEVVQRDLDVLQAFEELESSAA